MAAITAPNMQLQQVIEQVWQNAIAQMTAGSLEIVFPANIDQMIGSDGLTTILSRYSSMIKATASMYHDQPSNVIRILPPPIVQDHHSALNSVLPLTSVQMTLAGSEAASNASSHQSVMSISSPSVANGNAKAGRKGKAKVPRPPNAFILYRQHHHPLIKAEDPQMTNNEISVRLGKQWKAEDESIKALYREKAEDAKQKHLRDHPEYQYQPRKPSEKKRRMTKRKAAALALVSQPQRNLTAQTSAASDMAPTTLSVSTTGSHVSAISPSFQASTPLNDHSVSIDSFEPEQVQVPDIIPTFEVSANGQYLSYDLVPFPDEDAVLAQMIDNHNAAGLPQHDRFDGVLYSYSAPQALEDYELAKSLVDDVYFEELLAANEQAAFAAQYANHDNKDTTADTDLGFIDPNLIHSNPA